MVAFFCHPFWRFLILYGVLYAGFGVQSPYLPSLLERRNLTPEATATLLAAGTAIRLVAGPAAGRLADIIDAPKAVLAACSAAAALIALGYLQATGIWLLFLVGVFHSAALAPLAPLTDTLALGSAAPGPSEGAAQRRFHYRWLRGAGSAAFYLRNAALRSGHCAVWGHRGGLPQCRIAHSDSTCRSPRASSAAHQRWHSTPGDRRCGPGPRSVAASRALSADHWCCGLDPW